MLGPHGKFFKLCEHHIQADRDRASRWREECPDEAKATTERYRAQLSIDQRKAMDGAKAKRWKLLHPDRNSFNSRQYEHRKRGAIGICTEAQLQARIDLFGRRCYLCGCDWDALPFDKKTIDHVIPIIRGGTNWPANLRPACRSCNSSKKDGPPKPWRHFLRTRFAAWSRMIEGSYVAEAGKA